MRIGAFLLLLLILFCPLAGQANTSAGGKVLYIALWAEYLPAWVLQEFSQETGIKVMPRFYAQRAAGYSLIADQAVIDLCLVSGGSMERLWRDKLLLPIDAGQLKNLEHLLPAALQYVVKDNNYAAIPYTWNLMGLVINKAMLDPSLLTSYKGLWNAKVKSRLYLPESPQMLAGIGLLAGGYSANESAGSALSKAYQKMAELAPFVDGISNYGMLEAMARGSAAVGVIWNGMVGAYRLAGLSNISFVLPEERPLLLIDYWVIPHSAGNVRAAYAFVDYLMRPDVAQRMMKEVGYPVINATANQNMPDTLKGNVLLNPPAELLDKAETERYVEAAGKMFEPLRRLYND